MCHLKCYNLVTSATRWEFNGVPNKHVNTKYIWLSGIGLERGVSGH